MTKGRIVKALSGFYYVQSEDGKIYACKGRGLFRNKQISPLVGDFVRFDKTNNEEGYIKEIAERKNELVRPPIVNVSKALIVSSITEPKFSAQLLDRFLVIVESKGIKPMIALTKKDLASEAELDLVAQYKAQYERIGYELVYFSLTETEVNERLLDFLKDDVTVIMGQSGVGKSTILNKINPQFNIETGEISQSLGRGRHTTRHVELHQVNGGLVADTPGFSSIDFDHIEADSLGNYFIDIKKQASYCKFRSCQHVKEPKCAVKAALASGDINEERYNHYLLFLQEILSRKPRY
ncbi:MAG TPA: ribosome small subunit-dependent GTPase A [Pseudogracilibacillus sp.]|nr:ribosome small subunit-dependent GTPase A [Pseudogracilibacillus sp.]